MNNNETIKTAELVNSYLPQITVSQTFSVMNTNNDTVVTLDEFFNTLNVAVKSAIHEESVSELLINLSTLESKLTNTTLDIEMSLPELQSFSSLFIAAQMYFISETFKLEPLETAYQIGHIMREKLNSDNHAEFLMLSSKIDKCFESTFDIVELAHPEGPPDYDEHFLPCLHFTIIFNCMTSIYVLYG